MSMQSMTRSVAPESYAEVLRHRGRIQAAEVAFRFLVDGESEEVRVTYGVLNGQALAIAAALHREGFAGKRVIMLYPPGLSFVSALFGCFYSGAIAVPSDMPRSRRPITRLEGIVSDCEPAAILTTSESLTQLQARFEGHPVLGGLPLIATDTISGDEAPEGVSWEASPHGLALIQYTSGSTSRPKGVMLSHRNLLANSAQIARAFDHDASASGIIWLPAFHDMGLIGGVLTPLYLGAPLVLMSPTHVVQKPLRWLDAISRYRATTSGGPNFIYDRCVDSVSDEQMESLDLSCWQVAFNGAEPVRAGTVRRFAEKFARCGFHAEAVFPCYGLAEATLLVSGGPKLSNTLIQGFDKRALELERNALPPRNGTPATELVGSGIAGADIDLRIVDTDSLKECAPGGVGEIWVSGPNIAMGYWNRPDQTSLVLEASLGNGRSYLRTGDLGFLQEDRLFIAGRIKDLLIFDGRNHYPQDIELTAEQSHPALGGLGGAAFAVQSNGTERLVVVHEVHRHGRGVDTDEVVRAIRQGVSDEHELRVSRVVLVKIGEVPRTSSGKVQRWKCRELLLEENLAVISDWRLDPGWNGKAPAPVAPEAAQDLAERTPVVDEVAGDLAEGPPAQEEPVGDLQEAPRVGERSGESEHDPTTEEIQNWLVAELKGRLPPLEQEIDIRAPFATFGLTSRESVEISGHLESWLGRRLSPTLIYDFPTIESLSRALAAQPVREANPAVADIGSVSPGEPIAIVGIACRFPGAGSPQELWQLLTEGRDAIREVPKNRWDPETTSYRTLIDGHDPDGTCLRWGGFLDEVDSFDAGFFGIFPREAVHMDPQQRLLLEVAWEALEDAGQTLDAVQGSRCGVFVGISTNDYVQLCLQQPDDLEPYWSTGNAFCLAANRISYFLDLKGPSLAVDTACSSSLVATHLAFNSLRNGECDMALAGGVNVILTPTVSKSFAQGGGLSPDGRCRAFDASANGMVRSEGVGVVVLKRLSRALQDGDQIYSVIRGSAVNQDGRSNGITAPYQASQEAVLREAYHDAGFSPAQVQYIEAHGAGTALGDLIEANALCNVLSKGRGPGDKCAIGSVKTNIGHLEAAAGVAGLIKVVLAMKHGQLPANLHFVEPNPNILFDEMPFRVQSELSPWPLRNGRRLAGVSSFGFGGTNAHLVLESVPDQALPSLQPGDPAAGQPTGSSGPQVPRNEPDTSGPAVMLLPLSAASPEALRATAGKLLELLCAEDASALPLPDLCQAASMRRTHHRERAVFRFRTREELLDRLAALQQGEHSTQVATGVAPSGSPSKLAFVFSGHGGQRWDMGRQLYEHHGGFRARVHECDGLLRDLASWSLREELLADESASRLSGTDIESLEINQVTQFALQVALADVWKDWGIEADAVVGHSFGEAAAAVVAGALSLRDGLRLVVGRGRLMSEAAKRSPTDSGMAAVRISREEAQPFLEDYEGRVVVSAYNSPKYTVLSGKIDALEEVIVALKKQKIGGRLMKVPGAGHTPELEPVRVQFQELISDLRPRAGTLSFYSTVSGGLVPGSELDTEYWGRNLVRTISFAPAIEQLSADGFETFLELGPAPLLVAAIQQCLEHHERVGLAMPSLRPDHDDYETLYRSLGELHLSGRPVNWDGLYRRAAGWQRLPTYAWQRDSYWLAPLKAGAVSGPWFGFTEEARSGHPVLGPGRKLAETTGTWMWESELNAWRFPSLNDHRLEKEPVVPAGVYLEAALAGAVEAFGAGPWMLEDVFLPTGLQPTDASGRLIQVTLTRGGVDEGRFQWHSRADDDPSWVLDARCQVRRFEDRAWVDRGSGTPTLEAARKRCGQSIDAEAFYESLKRTGQQVGPGFRGLEGLWCGRFEAVGRLAPDASFPSSGEWPGVHPALITGCLHLVSAARGDASQWLTVPTHMESVRLTTTPPATARLWAYAALRGDSSPGAASVADVLVRDEGGQRVLEIEGLRVERLRCADTSAAMQDPREWLHEVQWRPTPLSPVDPPAAPPPPGTWVLFADADGIAADLERSLSDHGQWCVMVTPSDGFVQSGPLSFELAPAQPEGYRGLFDAVLGLDLPPVRGVLQLWGCRAAGAETSLHTIRVAEDLLMVSTLHLIQAVDQTEFAPAPRLWMITRRAQLVPGDDARISMEQTPLWGLGRTLQREHPSWRCTLVDLSEEGTREGQALREELLADDTEDQLAFRDGIRYVARLARPAADHELFASPLAATTVENFELQLRPSSDGPAITLQQTSSTEPGPAEIEVEVHAASLATGDLHGTPCPMDRPHPPPLGWSAASGRVVRAGDEVSRFAPGDEVIVLLPQRAASSLNTTTDLVVRRPQGLSAHEAAASMPALMLALHALESLGQLAPGERVLIQGASTSVGLAALRLAGRAGAEILVTGAHLSAENASPGATGVRLLESDTGTLTEQVLFATGGEGVDLVLDCRTADLGPVSSRCLRPCGRYVEVVSHGGEPHGHHGIQSRSMNLAHFTLDPAVLCAHRPHHCRALLERISGMLESAGIEPLPARTLSISEAVEVFSTASLDAEGQVLVLTLKDREKATVTPARLAPQFSADATYLIAGGLGGIGLFTANWMLERGARYFVLMSRRAPNQASDKQLEALRAKGANVYHARADLINREEVRQTLEHISSHLPPLRGVLHCASTLDDIALALMKPEQLKAVMASKTIGAWNLHEATLDIPLDLFVLFSSGAALIGPPGSANYAAGNAFLDALAAYRRHRGLPALSVGWGLWGDVGMVTDSDQQERIKISGFRTMPAEAASTMLGQLLQTSIAHIAVMPVDWARLRRAARATTSTPFLEEAFAEATDDAYADLSGGGIAARLRAAGAKEREPLLLEYLQNRLAITLEIDPEKIPLDRSLTYLGVDSLMALEMKNRVEAELQISIRIVDMLEGPTLQALTASLLKQIERPAEEATGATTPGSGDGMARPARVGVGKSAQEVLDRIDELGEEDLDALYKQMMTEQEETP
jgi:phthiocerol/phenolphthiocerol synthesis type-I polyketide synthase C